MAKKSAPEQKLVHYRILIQGVVQGVGFRPFVYNLARSWGVKGSVLNSSRGVIIEAEGKEENVANFINKLKENPPSLAVISDFQLRKEPLLGYAAFDILSSRPGTEIDALVPPDVGTCPACVKELFDPLDRHYAYPFTNCTNCGPRFTIINEIPYDRPKTSMASFGMCAACAREYHKPGDRRFHAQPVACPECGPQLELVGCNGERLGGKDNWLEQCWNLLQAGKILAIKSLGGFHLTCNANNPAAIAALRRRKGRDAKPFAVMCRDTAAVQKYCEASENEIKLLTSPQAPIVILRKKFLPEQNSWGLPEDLAPGLKTLGVMLPYTPLHHLLFSGPFEALVMTSGNYSTLPLVKDNRCALSELGRIADCFLWHNRDIINRCDDSLTQVIDGETHIFRRSRGYVPHPVTVSCAKDAPVILGVGGEMKNSFCLLKKNQAFFSAYIGEIDSLEGEKNLFNSLLNFQKLIGVVPEIVAYDAHPDYASARVARKIPARSYVAVQHHHAHLASCLAENGEGRLEAIGVILDGTGYGTDGHLWGFEILTGSDEDFLRHFHLAYVPLPGGEMAIRQTWRSAVGYLVTFLGEAGKKHADSVFKDKVSPIELNIVTKMAETGFNAPLSSGCGRLFDAVSALLGICLESTYEGQAAVELGEAVMESAADVGVCPYPYDIAGEEIRPGPMIAGIIADRLAGEPVELISARFHMTIVSMIVDAVERVSAATGLRKVVFSGGVWQNRFLFRAAKEVLGARGFKVLYHRQVPANDGGIALGQVMIAHRRWLEKCV
ncbi:MAG: Carbamoyltransferase HypF [Pelotomaculum sp. PtaB.Bin104]|nr:MAG: Carbamoyltransferase HypF [Pelotomaculum sp. PtaB.Bin104]